MRYNNSLFQLVWLFSFLVVLVATGPGLYKSISMFEWMGSWQHEMFRSLCHQIPERSFQIGGGPMAVCSRCFGIYVSFFAAITVLPLLSQTEYRRRYAVSGVILAILINLIDVGADLIQIWENTLTSRFLVGALFGSSVAVLLGTDNPLSLKKLYNYGT